MTIRQAVSAAIAALLINTVPATLAHDHAGAEAHDENPRPIRQERGDSQEAVTEDDKQEGEAINEEIEERWERELEARPAEQEKSRVSRLPGRAAGYSECDGAFIAVAASSSYEICRSVSCAVKTIP